LWYHFEVRGHNNHQHNFNPLSTLGQKNDTSKILFSIVANLPSWFQVQASSQDWILLKFCKTGWLYHLGSSPYWIHWYLVLQHPVDCTWTYVHLKIGFFVDLSFANKTQWAKDFQETKQKLKIQLE
jgi:hypothetical protein